MKCGHDSLSALLDLHQLRLERLVLAELAKAVSDHDTSPPGLDPHLREFDFIGETAKKEKLFHGIVSGKEVKGEVAWLAVGHFEYNFFVGGTGTSVKLN